MSGPLSQLLELKTTLGHLMLVPSDSRGPGVEQPLRSQVPRVWWLRGHEPVPWVHGVGPSLCSHRGVALKLAVSRSKRRQQEPRHSCPPLWGKLWRGGKVWM